MDNSVYKDVTADQIKQNGQRLIQPVMKRALYSKAYHRTSRYLGLSQLKPDLKSNKVTIMGIVTNYKITYHHIKNEDPFILVFLLLKNVYGITDNHKMNYITDHLWLDINMMEYLHTAKKISIGDTIKLQGFIKSYRGYLGGYKHRVYFGELYKQYHFDSSRSIYGTKWGIKGTNLLKCGYPIIKHNQVSEIVPYEHDGQYLIQSLGPFGVIEFGDELRASDEKKLQQRPYQYCNFLSHLIKLNIRHTGITFKKKHNVKSYLNSINHKSKNVHYLMLSLDFSRMRATLKWTKHNRPTNYLAKMVIFKYTKHVKQAVKNHQTTYKQIIRQVQNTLKSILWTPPYIPFIESMIITNKYYK